MNTQNRKSGNTVNEVLIPRSLDQIITKNRDFCSLSLSSQNDIDLLPSIVQMVGTPKVITGKLNDWHFICLNKPTEAGGSSHFLVGIHESKRCAWSTSSIVAVDLRNGFALTKSGNVYSLGQRGDGEPKPDILLHICAQLHLWGMGEALGVLHVFY